MISAILPGLPSMCDFQFFRCLHLDFTFSFHQRMKRCQIAFLTVIYWNLQSSSLACQLLLLYLTPDRIVFLEKLFQLQIKGGNILNWSCCESRHWLRNDISFLHLGQNMQPSRSVGGSNGQHGPFRVEQVKLRHWVYIDKITLEDQAYLELCF